MIDVVLIALAAVGLVNAAGLCVLAFGERVDDNLADDLMDVADAVQDEPDEQFIRNLRDLVVAEHFKISRGAFDPGGWEL